MNTKQQLVASIEAAKADLEQALHHLEELPNLDWGTVRYALHTLGNYLNITSACVQLLGAAIQDHADPEVPAYLRALERTTDLMVHMTRHLSHVSAVREVPLLREDVNLVRMAQRGCDFYQSFAGNKRIGIFFEAHEPVGHALGDRIAVATVLDNLLSNAVKYSPHGKRVWVRIKAEPGHVVCEVQDEGPGLTADDQARLFREGQRLGPRPTGGEASTGYGLAISRDLVKRMGGRIWCDSQPGQGATFSFRLPVYGEPVAETPAAPV